MSQFPNKKWALIIAFVVIAATATSLAANYVLNNGSDSNNSVNQDTEKPNSYEKVVTDYATGFNQTLQQRVIDGFKSKGNITSEDARQIEFLKALPYAEQVISIVNGSFTDTDWDKDRMNNRFEQTFGMPWDVYNGRYALLVRTDNITRPVDDMGSFLINEQKFLPQNVMKLTYTNATAENFKQAISDLSHKVNGNDIVYVGLMGHGGHGTFGFNDGKGNDQPENLKDIMYYKDMDKILDTIKPKEMLITIFACYSETALEPLKEGPSPRVFADICPHWFYNTSENYPNFAGAPEPKVFDTNGDRFVSIDESLKIAAEYQRESGKGVNVADKDNIASKLYLGDFKIQD